MNYLKYLKCKDTNPSKIAVLKNGKVFFIVEERANGRYGGWYEKEAGIETIEQDDILYISKCRFKRI